MTVFKKAILFLHRWLGLISGLVVFIVSITGCIFCFQDEIQDALHSYRKVEVQSKPFLKPSVLHQQALQYMPAGKVSGTIYNGPSRPALVGLTDKAGYHNIYVNPYNGKVLHDDLLQSNFFTIVQYIHLYLLLPENVGRIVVGTSVLIFVALMITGMVLWWPKRKTDRKRSFTIKWGARWRRVNYDLHNVLGFYSITIALVLAITGLSMSFEWVREGIYKGGNLGKTIALERKEFQSDSTQKAVLQKAPAIDVAYTTITQQSPQAQMLIFYGAGTPGQALYGIAYEKPLRYSYRDSYQFDQYTGKMLMYLPNVKKSLGLKLEDMNYDIHVGQIAGLPGKILAFIVSLICASLPVTGLIIYLGKRKKKPIAEKVRSIAHKRSQQHLDAVLHKAQGRPLQPK
jgi:uncharacterized iron-regulated membrane protein